MAARRGASRAPARRRLPIRFGAPGRAPNMVRLYANSSQAAEARPRSTPGAPNPRSTAMRNSSVRRWAPAARLATGLALSGLLAAAPAFAYPDGPPDGFAGNPPNFFSCVLCHGTYDVNSGDGSLELLGLPAAYTPGATYDLTVKLQDPGQMRWGF